MTCAKNLITLILLLTIISGFSGCTDSSVGDGSVCSRCKSDDDCDPGLSCSGFYNKNGVYYLCASSGTRSCPVK